MERIKEKQKRNKFQKYKNKVENKTKKRKK